MKETGPLKYILFGGLFWELFVWATTNLLNKTKQNTLSEIYFSKNAALYLLFYLIAGILLYLTLWHFHKYRYKKAISKQNGKQND